MHVLLIHPPSPFLTNQMVFPPLGVLYLAAALERANFSVKVVDLGLYPSGYLGLTDLARENPKLIGVSSTTPQYYQVPGIIHVCREIWKDTPIIVGGPHFSVCPEDRARCEADSVGLGDCEEAIIRATADAILKRKLSRQYYSLGWVVNPNQVPPPARHLLPIRRYRYYIGNRLATTMVTQRGCPYSCSFCCHWEGYTKVRATAVSNVIQEVGQVKRLGFGAVMFYDDEFNLNQKRTEELCEALRPEELLWRCFIRTNLFNSTQAKAMRDSGCVEVCAGVESANNGILNLANKHATIEQATQARHTAGECGLRFKSFFILGLPGETEETAEAIRQWLIQNRPDEFDLTVFTDYRTGSHYKGRPGEYEGKWAGVRDRIDSEVRKELGL